MVLHEERRVFNQPSRNKWKSFNKEVLVLVLHTLRNIWIARKLNKTLKCLPYRSSCSKLENAYCSKCRTKSRKSEGNENECNLSSNVISMTSYWQVHRVYIIYLWTGYEGDSKFMVSRDVNYDPTRSGGS